VARQTTDEGVGKKEEWQILQQGSGGKDPLLLEEGRYTLMRKVA
jgi:hypothetical protein